MLPVPGLLPSLPRRLWEPPEVLTLRSPRHRTTRGVWTVKQNGQVFSTKLTFCKLFCPSPRRWGMEDRHTHTYSFSKGHLFQGFPPPLSIALFSLFALFAVWYLQASDLPSGVHNSSVSVCVLFVLISNAGASVEAAHRADHSYFSQIWCWRGLASATVVSPIRYEILQTRRGPFRQFVSFKPSEDLDKASDNQVIGDET